MNGHVLLQTKCGLAGHEGFHFQTPKDELAKYAQSQAGLQAGQSHKAVPVTIPQQRPGFTLRRPHGNVLAMFAATISP